MGGENTTLKSDANVMALHVQCKVHAFSLVEVVIALAIISTACILLIGLLATGLGSFSQAIQTSVQAQILERISNDLKFQTYTSTLTTNLYFDDEGDATTNATSSLYSAAVTLSPAQLSSDAGPFPVSDTVATKVVVVISKRSVPTSTNTLLWSNTGT